MRQHAIRSTLIALLVLPALARAEDFDVPGDFDTVQAAVDAAGDGDTVVIRSSLVENVVVDGKTDLKIVGKGKVSIDGDAAGSVLTITNCTGVTVEKLGIEGGDPHGILVEDSFDVVISKCTITTSVDDAIHAERADDLVVEKCTLMNGLRGVVVDESDNFSIEKNKIQDFEEDGIALSRSGKATSNGGHVEKNTITDVDDGIVLIGNLNRIEKNKLSMIADDGIEVDEVLVEGEVKQGNVVEKNQIKGAGEDGIILRGLSSTAEKNKLQDCNGNGLVLAGGGSHTASKNKIMKAGNSAIAVVSGSVENFLEKNNCKESGEDGIALGSDDNRLEGNKVNKANGYGVFVDGAGNVLTKNKATQSGIFDLRDAVGGNTYDSNSFGTVDPDGFQP